MMKLLQKIFKKKESIVENKDENVKKSAKLAKKKKRKIRRRRNLIIILVIIFLPWILLIAFRNQIVDRTLENSLAWMFSAPVEVSGLHIGIFKPGFVIKEIAIDDAEYEDYFLIKTGRIKVSYQIRPFLQNRLISVPEILFENFQAGVEKTDSEIARSKRKLAEKQAKKKGNASSLADLDIFGNMLEAINIEEVLSNFTIIQEVEALSKNVESLQENGSKVIEQSAKQITNIKNEVENISQNIQSSRDFNSLQSNLNQAQSLVIQSQQTIGEINVVANEVNTYAKQIKKYSQNITESIENDITRVIDEYTDPSKIAKDIAIDTTKNIIKSKMTKYKRVTDKIIVALERAKNSSSKDQENNISKQETSNDGAKNEENNTQQADSKPSGGAKSSGSRISFKIGLFRVSLGGQGEEIIIFESENITNGLYTSAKPTNFLLKTSDNVDDGVRVEGHGDITLFPEAPHLLSVDIQYQGLPYRVADSNLSQLQLENIEGLLTGNTEVVLANKHTGRLSTSLNTQTTEIKVLKDAEFGQSIADGIEENAPIDVSAKMDIVSGELNNISIESEFVTKIATILTSIVKREIEKQAETIRKELLDQAQILVSEQLGVSTEILDGVNNLADEQRSRADEISNQVQTTKDEAQGKVSKLAKEQAEALKKAAEEEAKKAAKDAIDNIKNALPF